MGFLDDLLGNTASDAANAAANDTYAKQRAAIGNLTSYGDQYANQFRDLAQGYQPYTSAGTSALTQLLAGLGLGPGAENFAAAYRATPGYQAGLDTGLKSLGVSSAARTGGTNQGSLLKAAMKFGSNYEDQRAGDYLSRLMGVSTQGLGATQASNATVGQGLQGQLGTRTAAFGGDMASAGTIGQGQIAGANAQAAGAQNIFNTGANLFGKALGAFGMPSFGGGGSAGFQPGSNAPSYPNPYGGSWYG